MPETDLYQEVTIKSKSNMAPAQTELPVYSGIEQDAQTEVIIKSLKCHEGKRERYNKRNVKEKDGSNIELRRNGYQGGGEKTVWVKDCHVQRPCRRKELSHLSNFKNGKVSPVCLYTWANNSPSWFVGSSC